MTEKPWIVRGEKVGLLTTSREAFMERWAHYGNDALMLMRTGNQLPPLTGAKLEEIWKRAESGSWLVFDVATVEGQRVVGEGTLMGISWPHASARIGMTILAPEDRGKGYGTEAVRLMAAYGFDALGLHRVTMEFVAANTGLARLGEAFGGRLVGVAREAVWAFGGHHDVMIYDALREDLEPHPATAQFRGEPPG